MGRESKFLPVQGTSVFGHWHYGDWRDFVGSICSAQVLDGHSGHNIDIDWPMVHLEDRRGSICGCITSNRLGLCAAGSDAFFVAKPRTRGALPAPEGCRISRQLLAGGSVPLRLHGKGNLFRASNPLFRIKSTLVGRFYGCDGPARQAARTRRARRDVHAVPPGSHVKAYRGNTRRPSGAVCSSALADKPRACQGVGAASPWPFLYSMIG